MKKIEGYVSETLFKLFDEGKNHHLSFLREPLMSIDLHVTLSLVEDPERSRPTIVCLCGSTRFLDAYKKASLEETMGGKIVLSIGCDMRTDKFFVGMSEVAEETVKDQLDELHLRKIDLADEVLILNVNGYIGESTLREIDYAKKQGKRIRYLFENLKNWNFQHTPPTGVKKEDT